MVIVPAILLTLGFLNIGENFKRIKLYLNGEETTAVTSKRTVNSFFKELHIFMAPGDDVFPSLGKQTFDGQVIVLTRNKSPLYALGAEKPVLVKTSVRFEDKKVPITFNVVKKQDKYLARGRSRRLAKGKNGLMLIRYRIDFAGGSEIRRRAISQKILMPVRDEIVSIGTGKAIYASRKARTASRKVLGSIGGLTGDTLMMTATAYWRYVGGTGRTSTGVKAGHGIVAVDPRVISLGTRVYVDGYGYAVAADTGGAIKGNRIDLCFNTVAEARRFGRRKVAVKIIR